MKKYLLLTLLCVGSATLYTADYNVDTNATDSSSKRFQKDDQAIQLIADELRQEVEDDQAVTSLAESLREECESDNSLDNTAAAPDTAAQLPETTAAPIAHTGPTLKGFRFHKAGEPCNPNTLALICSDEFRKRVQEALDLKTFLKKELDGSLLCRGTFNKCKTVHYINKQTSLNITNLKSHCTCTHLTHEDLSVVTSLIIKLEENPKQKRTGNKAKYRCAICSPEKLSPRDLKDVRLHIATDHILKKSVTHKPSTV